MKRLVVLTLFLLLGHEAALAAPATATGPAALALASVVAEHSPLLGYYDRKVMARLFDGHLNFFYPKNKKISVKADAVVCRTSDVDITRRSCDLTFGTHKRSLTGRRAHEVYATAVEAGIASEGAAGSIIESFSNLVCTIDPNEIKQKAGGGADCMFDTGP
jgi:hypothetical protein